MAVDAMKATAVAAQIRRACRFIQVEQTVVKERQNLLPSAGMSNAAYRFE